MAALRTSFGADVRVFSVLKRDVRVASSRNSFPQSRLSFCRAGMLALALAAAPLSLVGTARAEVADAHGAATQWAQMILKEKGLYKGRPTSRLDEQTVAGLRQYQKNQGLPVTGRLDDATVEEMMKGRPVDKTVTNLADPQARARNAQPKLREEDAKPHAAQSAAGVQQAGPGQDSTVLGFSRAGAPTTTEAAPSMSSAPSVAAPPASSGAASRSGDVVSTEPPRPGHAIPSGGAADAPADDAASGPHAADRAAVEAVAEPAADSPLPFDPAAAPSWVRFGLMGFVGLLFAFMAWMWWWSGRRPRHPKVAPGRAGRDPLRREPSLGRGALRTVDGRLEPHFEDPAPAALSRQRGHR